MAYNGYLIRLGTYSIPLSVIQASSYKVTRASQDYDSYRDANGTLHRFALDNFVPKVEFNIRPMLTNTDIAEIMENIRNNMTNAVERSFNASIYLPETDSYIEQKVYMADFSPEMYYADGTKIQYKSFRMAFIGYGK